MKCNIQVQNIIQNAIPRLIQKHRYSKSLTQESLAKITGVHVQTVKNWEHGKSTPGITDLFMLMDVFGAEFINDFLELIDFTGAFKSNSEPQELISFYANEIQKLTQQTRGNYA